MSVDNENIDPNPDACAICYEPYETNTICRSSNDRCPSKSCRHAMCLQCAIQHAFASNRTACPFCRAPGAYSEDEFSALLNSNPEQETSMDAAAVTPQVLELLQAAKVKRDEARAEHEAFLEAMHQNMQAMHRAMLFSLIGEDAVHTLPDDAVFRVSVRMNADGSPAFSLQVLTPRDDDAAVGSSEAAAEELD